MTAGTKFKGVVGVAGCGTMGLPMAQRMHDAGFEVWGHDVRPSDDFGEFAERMIMDPAEFARRCDVVILICCLASRASRPVTNVRRRWW